MKLKTQMHLELHLECILNAFIFRKGTKKVSVKPDINLKFQGGEGVESVIMRINAGLQFMKFQKKIKFSTSAKIGLSCDIKSLFHFSPCSSSPF